MTETETFTTIYQWQTKTFPNATTGGMWDHIWEEWEEFQSAITVEEQIVEAVDLIILLTGWIAAADPPRSPQYHVDAKMRLNRMRKWNIQPDGTGRHQ